MIPVLLAATFVSTSASRLYVPPLPHHHLVSFLCIHRLVSGFIPGKIAKICWPEPWSDRYDLSIYKGDRSIASSLGTAPRFSYNLDGTPPSFYLRDMPSNIMAEALSGPNCTGMLMEGKSRTHICFGQSYGGLRFEVPCKGSIRRVRALACNVD